MENDPQSALGYLNRGISAFEDGQLEVARRHFAQALLREPDNEIAWLWLAEASQTSGQKRYCFDRAVAINPDSSALFRLEAMRAAGVESEVPPVISDLAKPPLPPSLRSSSKPATPLLVNRLPVAKSAATRWNKRLWLALAAIAVVLLAGAWLIFLRTSESHRDVLYLAVAAPLTGDATRVGDEMRDAAIMARDYINTTLTDGPRVELLFFDDQQDPERAAEIARQIVQDDRIAGVIGHSTSDTSLAAAPIYEAAGMPVISGQATSDSLDDFPNYFRTIFSNNDEATILAHYLRHDLDRDRVSIVTGQSIYEQSLAEDFEREFGELGTIVNVWTIGEDRAASVAEIVAEMQESEDMGALFLAVDENDGYEMVLQLRNAGLDPLIVGSESLGSQWFARRFASEPQAQDDPNFYTQNMYAVSPLIYDAVGGETLAFARQFRQSHGMMPDWRAPKTWDAIMAFATAAGRGNVPFNSAAAAETRSQLIAQLQAMNSPETGFQGLSGAVFFTGQGSSPQGLSVGVFDDGELISAPDQYRLLDNPENYDLDAELESGNVIDLGGYYVRKFRVAYVGIEMIELRDLSTTNQTFKADFYIYFRYFGDDAPLDVIFTNAASGDLGLGDPLAEEITDSGMNYRLFRVTGTFNEPMDFSDYPWDQHQLTIRFQNTELTHNDIMYVADPQILAKSQAERLQSGFDASRRFDRVPSWDVVNVQYEQDAVASTSSSYDSEGTTYFSEFLIVMGTARDVSAFLAKNLLPLALLTLVTYIAIWFPAEQAGARIGFAITALLSSSVMLNSISSQLPSIGYNVAIEWGYYAYIALSAMLVLLTIAVDRSFKAKRKVRTRRLDIFIRTMYPLAIGSVVALYWFVYREGSRSAGGQDDIRLGVSIITGLLLAASTLVLLLPDHFDWRALRGYNDPDLTSTLEPSPEGKA